MSTNGANTADDADMMECDGEKVVTMMDVLKEQQEFEEDANAVLGGSDDKNCTYPKGYIKRQAIYVCMTCTDAREDSSKRAGVCLACSLNCHESHELVELYTKRNFRCDCGNPKFNSNPCQFTSNKTDLNAENKYNQNFSGLYCVCHRPYPDPESPTEDDMIQCIICEDWLHSSHLDAVAPSNEQYSEMVCKECMEKNQFLHDYSDLAVLADNVNVTKITNDESDINISVVENDDVNEIQNDTITSKQDDSIHFNNHSLNHTNQSEKTPNRFTSKDRDALTKNSTDVQIEEKIVNECFDNISNSEAISEKSHNAFNLNNLPANDKTDVEASENEFTNKEDNITAVDLNSTKENEINSDSKQVKDDDYKISEKDENELLRDENIDDITEKKLSPQKITNVIENEDENTERNHSPIKNNENELLRDENMDDITEKKLSPQKITDVIENEDENTERTEVEASENELTNKEDNSTAVDLNSTKENEINSDSKQAKDDDYKISENNENELLRDENMDDITEKKLSPQKITDVIDNEVENTERNHSPIKNNENELLRDENMDDFTEKKLSPQKITDVIEKEDENTDRNHSSVKNNDNEAAVNEESVANDSKSNVTDKISSSDEKNCQEGVTDDLTNSNNTDNDIETENNLDAPTDIEKTDKVTDETTVGSNGKVNDEVPSENGDNLKEQMNVFEETMEISKDTEIDNSSDVNASDKQKENNLGNSSGSNENKRKHIDNEELVSNKKPKLRDTNCLRPQGVKRIFKGATFWPHNFRQKLCTCSECLTMYKDLSVLFLIDPEDTVSAYEHLGKEKSNGETPSQYEKGLEALSSLGRVQQINALTEYNKMRDKLLDFLKSFKDRDEVVKEEDIKAFFAGMKPKREPDGVYFCR